LASDTEHGNIETSGQWQVINADKECIAKAEILIIACAHTALNFPQLSHLRLKSIRGQVSHIPASAEIPLNTVLCGDGYIAPSDGKIQSLGATFNLHSSETSVSIADHQSNIDNLEKVINLEESIAPSQLEGRVGFRSTSLDYFPLTGPVADKDAFMERFLPWRKNANKAIAKPGVFHQNLYANLGFGSRGLAYSPLCAEVLASIICGEPLPLDAQLYQHLHPARFLMRDLKRNKT